MYQEVHIMDKNITIQTFEQMAKWLLAATDRLAKIEKGDLSEFSKSKIFEKEILEWWRDQLSIDIIKNIFYSESPALVKYPPLKWRVGTPLLLTGLMRELAVRAANDSRYEKGCLITDVSEPFYWSFQNYGTYIIPQREFVGPRPDTMKSLGERFSESVVNWSFIGDD